MRQEFHEFTLIFPLSAEASISVSHKTTLFHSKESPPKIDQQTDAESGGGEIIQHLFDVQIRQFFDSFDLKENLIPDHKVRVIIVRQDDSLVGDFVIFLAREWNSSPGQFNNEERPCR